MNCQDIVARIDQVLCVVLSRVSLFQDASVRHAQSMKAPRPGQTPEPGLEAMLCAEIYLAFQGTPDLRGLYVQLPVPGQAKQKIDLGAAYGDKFVYVEAKMYNQKSTSDYQKDFHKLFQVAEENAHVVSVWLHFGFYPSGIQPAKTAFADKRVGLDSKYGSDLAEIGNLDGIRFIRLAFWQQENQTGNLPTPARTVPLTRGGSTSG